MSYSDEVLADAPTVYLKCDDASGNLTDSSGNGHTATAAGSPGYGQTGPMTGALAIDTTSGDFSVADHADVDLGNGPFSIELWFKRTSADAGQYPLGKTDSSFATAGYCIEIRQAATDTLRLQNGATSTHCNNTAQLINDTAWHHAVFTRAAATAAKLYIDGTAAAVSTSAMTFTDNALALVIGALYSGNSRHQGLISRVAIYKSELSAARVAAHFDAATAGEGSSASGSASGSGAGSGAASGTKGAAAGVASAGSGSGAASGELGAASGITATAAGTGVLAGAKTGEASGTGLAAGAGSTAGAKGAEAAAALTAIATASAAGTKSLSAGSAGSAAGSGTAAGAKGAGGTATGSASGSGAVVSGRGIASAVGASAAGSGAVSGTKVAAASPAASARGAASSAGTKAANAAIAGSASPIVTSSAAKSAYAAIAGTGSATWVAVSHRTYAGFPRHAAAAVRVARKPAAAVAVASKPVATVRVAPKPATAEVTA